tara:strand:- start:13 stop:243 length:231 start_codon:yes stop_codon:yes gene_type:complete
MSRRIDKTSKITYYILRRYMNMDTLIAEKMALEAQWNFMYTSTGVYSIEMKDIEKKIDTIKGRMILKDIASAKNIT